MKHGTKKWCAAGMVASMALVEPALGRLDTLGDALDARQYLLIAPTGELAHLFPPARRLRTRTLALLALLLFSAGAAPALSRLRERGADRRSAPGWAMLATGAAVMAGEYAAAGEWVIGRIGARYLAMTMVASGAFLASRDRGYLGVLGVGAFTWDVSSAIFWAALNRSLSANVPVPWYHHFDQEEGRGAPCWLVMVLDGAGICFFSWVLRSETDPLSLFD